MLKVLIIMILGIVLGAVLRNKKQCIKISNKSIIWVIFVLLFFMGISVGGNPEIMQNLDSIGLRGLELSLAAVLGSIILSWGVYVLFFKQNKNITSTDSLTQNKL